MPARQRLARTWTDSLRTLARRALRYRGLAVVVLWQAPVGPAVAPDGSIALLFGGGFDELAKITCEGDLINARSIGYGIAGFEAEHDIGSRGRGEIAGGLVGSGESLVDGPFGAVRMRADWTYIGVGGGIGAVPVWGGEADRNLVVPSAYLRIGPAARLHARGDLFEPSPLVAQQFIRLGVGWNATRRDRPSGFVGIAGAGALAESTGVAGELDVPLDDRVGFRLTGHYVPGRQYSVWGIVAGGSYLLR